MNWNNFMSGNPLGNMFSHLEEQTQHFFSESHHHHVHHVHHQQQPPGSGMAPPASSNIINRLPMVKVTADDLIEVANRECAVCLEDQTVGSYACKLPCGHLFHQNCVRDWLVKHCTCPICRFELQTDDHTYEQDRKKRMKTRKLRYRKEELQAKKVGQLKEISASLSVSIEGCLDKSEIVDRLIASGMIDITEGVPTIEFTPDEFNAKGVKELKNLLVSFGLSDEGALEKSELRARLIDSKRIVLIEDSVCDGAGGGGVSGDGGGVDEEQNASKSAHASSIPVASTIPQPFYSNYASSSSSSSSSSKKQQIPQERTIYLSQVELANMTISEYKRLLMIVGVSYAGVCEKEELKRLLLASPKVVLRGVGDDAKSDRATEKRCEVNDPSPNPHTGRSEGKMMDIDSIQGEEGQMSQRVMSKEDTHSAYEEQCVKEGGCTCSDENRDELAKSDLKSARSECKDAGVKEMEVDGEAHDEEIRGSIRSETKEPISGVPAVFKDSELSAMTFGELRHLAGAFCVDMDDCATKEDVLQKLADDANFLENYQDLLR